MFTNKVKEQKFKAKNIEGGGQFDPPLSRLLGLMSAVDNRSSLSERKWDLARTDIRLAIKTVNTFNSFLNLTGSQLKFQGKIFTTQEKLAARWTSRIAAF